MSGRAQTVLYVEDDPRSRRLFEEAAAESQFADLLSAACVDEALGHFPSRGDGSEDETTPPTLVILDLELPGRGGLALLEELKSSPTSLSRIPVIILSSNDDQETIDRAYDLGASAYVTKPSDYDDLMTLMEELREFWLARIESPTC